MDDFGMKVFAYFNEMVTLFAIFPGIILLGAYLTWKLKCVQLTQLKKSFSFLIKKSDLAQGTISHYEAISSVLAGNFGTGNISGMAVAIATGGPGALVWMWIMAFFASVIQYASCLLGVVYRQKNAHGDYVGGPMYYISLGLGRKRWGGLFAVLAIIAACTVGNLTQVNSVILPLKAANFDPLLSSLVLAGLIGIVILGGIKRFARIAASIVPLMAILYLTAALIILSHYHDRLIAAFSMMFYSAFDPVSFMGGFLGFGVLKTISIGFCRGIFATDAGTGMAPMIQSSAKTIHPVVDGIVALVAPFLVMIVCTITGLVLIVTEAWKIPGLVSTNMCTYAFEIGLGGGIGTYIVTISLLLFAYTTILAWSFCAERAIEYLGGASWVRWFKYGYISIIPVGAFFPVDLVWVIADTAISLMMVTNLIAIIGLSDVVIRESAAFFNSSLLSNSKKVQIYEIEESF